MSAAEDFSDADESGLSDELDQFVTFVVGGETFAVDMNPVQEIIRVPETVRVPLSPPAMTGLANLRGRILPIVSLRHIFGLDAAEVSDASRAVVIDIGQPMGFLVDRVSSVIEIDGQELETTARLGKSVDIGLLKGVIRQSGKNTMIMVLDCQAIMNHEFVASDLSGADSLLNEAFLDDDYDDEDDDNSEETQLVSFVTDEQEYAIPIADVKEIVQMPERITAVPRAAAHMLGLMNLREQVLPLIDIRTLFELRKKSPDEKSRVIVLASEGKPMGVVVDSVNEVLRVPNRSVEPMVPVMTRDATLSEITGICRLNDGKRLVSVLDTARIFSSERIKESLAMVEEDIMQDDNTVFATDDDADDDSQVVVFRLADEEYAVPINSVQEIVRIPDELIHVPKAPAFLEGVINLRGMVLPVVDLRTQLGLAYAERTDRHRIIVFVIHGVRTGFIVDQVSEVLRLPPDCVEPSPKIPGEHGDFFSGMANLSKSKRMLQMIRPERLIDQVSSTGAAEA
ncbi:MAG: chemotaxis protein CheW [Saccharospirillaceae bacterium]|nr:chemotaxis protein CheW [Saccharospirillaceae bacterium]MCD8531486.1 chemotaxis protein CheW [Saccharospirillaceae bacterium]